MNFEIIKPLQPGEGLISHGSIQFSSSNVVVFAVGLETINNNNNYNHNNNNNNNNTDHLIQARRPDLVYVNKLTRKTYLIDIACVMDHNVLAKEKEKVDKYLSLMIELQSLWNTTVEVVPIIFGALGSLSDNIFTNLSLLQVTDINAYQLQKTVLLRTATILRRHLALPSSS